MIWDLYMSTYPAINPQVAVNTARTVANVYIGEKK